jgi:glycerol-3-phosphate dehydrogenase subunit C
VGEGSLEAPQRHPIAWDQPEFFDEEKLDAELRRAFDICHGCRRCFNLCDSFPRLFDLVDECSTGEVDGVASTDFGAVIDACTLCDMCFLTKCPYVPPHEFDLDFPHLMLRARAVRFKNGNVGTIERQLTKTDRNGRLAGAVAPLANWASKRSNALTRPLMQATAGIHRDAALPRYHAKTLTRRATPPPELNREAPAFGRKAVLYATCFANYNNPEIGIAAQAVLARNGVETAVVHPACCGMPQLEHGDIAAAAKAAGKVAGELVGWIDKGYDVVSLVPSCSLMVKFEWPLIVPDNENVQRLAAATFDISQYIVDLAKEPGLARGLKPLAGGVTVHIACHARAQNIGRKGADMLALLPDTPVQVIERCSGHGGTWGILKDTFPVALKVGKPVARQAAKNKSAFLVSECPLAREHIVQGIEALDHETTAIEPIQHPVQLIARSYGLS